MVLSGKGQAAMEFMVTYGWAVLLLMVVMGVLVYIGLFQPEDFVPDRCMLATGFHCQSYYATANPTASDPVKLNIVNSLGQPITGMTVAVKVDGNLLPPATSDCVNTQTPVSPNGFLQCGYQLPPGASAGNKVKGEMIIQWRDQSGNTRTRTGNLAVTVDP